MNYLHQARFVGYADSPPEDMQWRNFFLAIIDRARRPLTRGRR